MDFFPPEKKNKINFNQINLYIVPSIFKYFLWYTWMKRTSKKLYHSIDYSKNPKSILFFNHIYFKEDKYMI